MFKRYYFNLSKCRAWFGLGEWFELWCLEEAAYLLFWQFISIIILKEVSGVYTLQLSYLIQKPWTTGGYCPLQYGSSVLGGSIAFQPFSVLVVYLSSSEKQKWKGRGQLCQTQSAFCDVWIQWGAEVYMYKHPEVVELGPQGVGELGTHLTMGDLWVISGSLSSSMNTVQ